MVPIYVCIILYVYVPISNFTQTASMDFSLKIDSNSTDRNLGTHYTVEPPRKGHFGELSFVLFSEVVLISETS